MSFKSFIKHFEIVENLDDHLTYIHVQNDGTLISENYFELDVVYFGFIRFEIKLRERKFDIEVLMKGFTLKKEIYRDIFKNWIRMICTHKLVMGKPFPGIYMRKTFLKFNNPNEIKDLFPEYFL